MNTAWHIARTGGTYECFETGYYDLVSLIAGPGDILRDMRSPILCARLGLDDENDGEARVREIIRNEANIPADDAITILMAIHNTVEHCGDGEVTAVIVGIPYWLTELFSPRRAEEIHLDLIQAVADRRAQS